jgi:hypothetical protein
VGPGWLERLGVAIDRLEDKGMCDERMTVVGRAAGRKAQRQHDAKVAADAVRAYQNGSAKPARQPLTPTQYAQRVLAVCGGIVGLYAMNFLLHAMLVTLAVLFAGVSATAVVVTVRRRRRTARAIPAPLPAASPRTVVTAVHIQAVESPSSARALGGELTRARGAAR